MKLQMPAEVLVDVECTFHTYYLQSLTFLHIYISYPNCQQVKSF